MTERSGRKAARDLCSRTGYAMGGHLGRKDDEASDEVMVKSGVHQHEKGMHKGEKPTRLKLADGGFAEGGTSANRSDRSSRRSKGHDGPKINILVSPRSPDAGAAALPPNSVPPRPAAPPMPPHPAMGGPPGMPPGMPMAPTPPMGGPPGGMPPRPMRAGGGVGPGTKHMTAGSATGQGRQQKSKNLPY